MTPADLDQDDIILNLLAADDQRAIDKLYTIYYERLFFSVRKLILNDQDTASILNDLMFTIWNKRHSLSLHKPLLFYLYRAARNRALNFLLRKDRLREILTDPEELNAKLERTSVEPDSPLQREDLQLLWTLAEIHLTYRTRQTFLLTHRDHKTPEEVAVEMRITVNAVQKNLARAWKVIERIKTLYFGTLFGSLVLLY